MRHRVGDEVTARLGEPPDPGLAAVGDGEEPELSRPVHLQGPGRFPALRGRLEAEVDDHRLARGDVVGAGPGGQPAVEPGPGDGDGDRATVGLQLHGHQGRGAGA